LLFNLQTDPSESQDVSGDHPQLVRELTEQYYAWQADVILSATQQPDRPE
jgi:hypothetical protein